MMTKTVMIKEKKFSLIEGLQEEKTILYELFLKQNGDEKKYGIKLTSKTPKSIIYEEIQDIDTDMDRAARILEFLFENSVSLYNFSDIVEDILIKSSRREMGFFESKENRTFAY